MNQSVSSSLRLKAWPDPCSPNHRYATTASIFDGVLDGTAEILHGLTSSPADSDLTLSSFYVFHPRSARTAQERLQNIVQIRGSDSEEVESMLRRILGGNVGLLFPFEEITDFDLPLDETKSAVVLTRPGHVVLPGVDRRDNPHVISEGYYQFGEIIGKRRCNHVTLDRVLSSLDETVVVAITVARADIAVEVQSLRAYAVRGHAPFTARHHYRRGEPVF